MFYYTVTFYYTETLQRMDIFLVIIRPVKTLFEMKTKNYHLE